jgi:hypothetical protein
LVSSVQAFSPGSFLFWQSNFSAKSVLCKVFGKSSALAFFQGSRNFQSKVGLVKNCRACKIKSLKVCVLVFKRRRLLAPVLANKACT